MKTLDLLEKALTENPSPKVWCDKLKVARSTLNTARNRGRLSPSLAGGLAMELGENAQQWIAVAALEAEPKTALLQRLQKQSTQLPNVVAKQQQKRPGRPGFFF